MGLLVPEAVTVGVMLDVAAIEDVKLDVRD